MRREQSVRSHFGKISRRPRANNMLALVLLLLPLADCASVPANQDSIASTTPSAEVRPAPANSSIQNSEAVPNALMFDDSARRGNNNNNGNGNRCPPLLGSNFPNQQRPLVQTNAQGRRVVCQWVIISDQQNCPRFFQNCGPNPPTCDRQNEIWWQCTSSCEPSCGNQSPSCRRSCGRSGCQCFPGFLRDQNGLCVPSDQCSSSCSRDSDCPGESTVCQNRQCRQGCTSDSACRQSQRCSNGRCVERQNCRSDSQCDSSNMVCVFGSCRSVTSLSCRSHNDCPGSAFCGRDGRCHFPFRSFDAIEIE